MCISIHLVRARAYSVLQSSIVCSRTNVTRTNGYEMETDSLEKYGAAIEWYGLDCLGMDRSRRSTTPHHIIWKYVAWEKLFYKILKYGCVCVCVVLYRKLKFSRLIVAVFVVGRVVNVGGNDFIIIMHILRSERVFVLKVARTQSASSSLVFLLHIPQTYTRFEQAASASQTCLPHRKCHGWIRMCLYTRRIAHKYDKRNPFRSFIFIFILCFVSFSILFWRSKILLVHCCE